MQLPIDIDFRTMTEASLNNLVTGCRRTDGHLRREFYRCESLARSAKNDMERDFYAGRCETLKDEIHTNAKAHNLLLYILVFNYWS